MHCAHHPDRVASARCPTCGQNVCSECAIKVRGVNVCTRCLQAELARARGTVDASGQAERSLAAAGGFLLLALAGSMIAAALAQLL